MSQTRRKSPLSSIPRQAKPKAQPASSTSLFARIAELERLVETISRSKMIWEGTFDVITDPVLIIDKDFTITRANKAAAHAASIDVKKIIGRKCYAAFAGYDRPCPKCPVPRIRSLSEPHSVELDAFPNHHQYSANGYSLAQLSSSDEVVLHYLDVTESKQMQKRLLHNEKMAAVGTLAGGIAHEINNPLGGILAFVQLAMRELDSAHSCQTDLKEIEDAALRCKKIVRNLLDFSRQNRDEQVEPVDLNEVVNKTMPLIKINARDVGVETETRLAERLPPISGHFQKLQQVVLNLITNALHAMKVGGKLTLTTRAIATKRQVVLRVADTGHGIDRIHLDKIFDPYFTTKDQGEGTGLGLAISYSIIKEHGGKIDGESDVGKGTVFTLTIEEMRSG
jgi:two-component system NtrC family sensor kinase